MNRTAVSSFDVTGWDQEPYEDDAGTPGLTRATVRKAFRGALEAESEARLLMFQSDPADPAGGAGYLANEVVTGTLEGRQGRFVLQHWGVMGDGAPRTGGQIVPGSGTGELEGISGSVEISVAPDGAHSLSLNYGVPAPGTD